MEPLQTYLEWCDMKSAVRRLLEKLFEGLMALLVLAVVICGGSLLIGWVVHLVVRCVLIGWRWLS